MVLDLDVGGLEDLGGDAEVMDEMNGLDENITEEDVNNMGVDISNSIQGEGEDLTPEKASENADINNPEDVKNLTEQANGADPGTEPGSGLGDKMEDSINEDKGKSIKDKVTDWMKDKFSAFADKLGLAAAAFFTYMALTGQSNPVTAAKNLKKGILSVCQKFFQMISQGVKDITNIIDFILKYWWVIAIVAGLIFILYIYRQFFSGGGGGSTQRIIMVPEAMAFKRRKFKN